jgi:hypothetical protein
MAVDALFEGGHFHDVGEVENLGLGDRALDGDGPGRGLQAAGAFGGIVFARAEFVEIVVAGDILERCRFLIGAEGALDGGQFGGGFRAGCEQGRPSKRQRGSSGGSDRCFGALPLSNGYRAIF